VVPGIRKEVATIATLRMIFRWRSWSARWIRASMARRAAGTSGASLIHDPHSLLDSGVVPANPIAPRRAVLIAA